MSDAFEPWGDGVEGCESETTRTGEAADKVVEF